MKYRSHFNDIVHHNHFRYIIYIIILLSLCGCGESENIDSKINAMKQAVGSKDFQKAEQILDEAETGIFASDFHVLEYNRAVIRILSGKCSEASELLENVYKTYSEQHAIEQSVLRGDASENAYSEKEKQERAFLSRVHLAMALADLCPSQPSMPHDDASYREILVNLYTAHTLGLDVRSQIETVTRLWIPDCSTFIPEAQKAASSHENALELETIDAQDLVVCREGVWLRYHLRAHEVLTPSLELKPLTRTVWLDDSSRLPFAQFHADIHLASANGTVQNPPVLSYAQPIPTTIPDAEAYESIAIDLPDFVPKADGVYYVHLYTVDNGEANVYVTGTRRVDCRFIDDEATWTSNLRQKTVRLHANDHLERLTLCPTRPDKFSFTLEPGQEAFVSIHVLNAEDATPHIPQLNFTVLDETERELNYFGKTTEEGMETDMETEAWFFQYRDSVPEEMLKAGSPFYVLVKNVTPQLHEYSLEIDNKREPKAAEYMIQMSASQPCSAEDRTMPLKLKDIEKTKVVSLPPFWTCPGQTIYFAPETDIDILRTKTNLVFMSNQTLSTSDVQLSSIMKVENDEHEYPVETGEKTDSYQTPEQFVLSSGLSKPMTRSTLIKESITDKTAGFSLLSVTLSDEDDQKKEDSSDSKDDKKDDRKQQHDKTKKQDTPNKSPDKPSESPATPQGAGTDTSGEESQPDEKADGNKAAKYDPTQNDIDHIDALLDDIERGNFYVPLSGSEHDRITDKDW
ncbi:MAG: hypothetical protein IJU23_05035 [Proteobacteria bacterium]|nr:hypothetical protein [Pseudomonadota bacterium]